MNEIPAEWEHIATEAIVKQRRVDELLRQPSKDEWFAKAVIAAVYPLVAAVERAKGARDVAERIKAARKAYPVPDALGDLTGATAQGAYGAAEIIARIYADEQGPPGGGDDG